MNVIVQGSPEWFAARLGKVTASRISDVIAKTKAGYGAGRANYMTELLLERLTGCKAESYTNAAMLWGTDNEPLARRCYEFMYDVDVEQVGIIDHPTISMSAASPDGLVGSDGMLEIKCPTSTTHIELLQGKKVPEKYKPQMAWQMACAGRKWCDFVSYDPRMPAHLQLFCVRYYRESALIIDLEREVQEFLVDLNVRVEQLAKPA